MKNIFILCFVVFTVACTTQKPLYVWQNYDTSSYNYLKDANEASVQQLINTYENLINNEKGARGVLPPGVYADYGFILLQLNQTEKGKMMLQQEVALYPESKVFIERVLKLFEE